MESADGEDGSTPADLVIQMIENGLPFLPATLTDYSEGTGLGRLTVNIDGQLALEFMTDSNGDEAATLDGPSQASVNGTVTIEVSYKDFPDAPSSQFELNIVLRNEDKSTETQAESEQ